MDKMRFLKILRCLFEKWRSTQIDILVKHLWPLEIFTWFYVDKGVFLRSVAHRRRDGGATFKYPCRQTECWASVLPLLLSVWRLSPFSHWKQQAIEQRRPTPRSEGTATWDAKRSTQPPQMQLSLGEWIWQPMPTTWQCFEAVWGIPLVCMSAVLSKLRAWRNTSPLPIQICLLGPVGTSSGAMTSSFLQWRSVASTACQMCGCQSSGWPWSTLGSVRICWQTCLNMAGCGTWRGTWERRWSHPSNQWPAGTTGYWSELSAWRIL